MFLIYQNDDQNVSSIGKDLGNEHSQTLLVEG